MMLTSTLLLASNCWLHELLTNNLLLWEAAGSHFDLNLIGRNLCSEQQNRERTFWKSMFGKGLGMRDGDLWINLEKGEG